MIFYSCVCFRCLYKKAHIHPGLLQEFYLDLQNGKLSEKESPFVRRPLRKMSFLSFFVLGFVWLQPAEHLNAFVRRLNVISDCVEGLGSPPATEHLVDNTQLAPNKPRHLFYFLCKASQIKHQQNVSVVKRRASEL